MPSGQLLKWRWRLLMRHLLVVSQNPSHQCMRTDLSHPPPCQINRQTRPHLRRIINFPGINTLLAGNLNHHLAHLYHLPIANNKSPSATHQQCKKRPRRAVAFANSPIDSTKMHPSHKLKLRLYLPQSLHLRLLPQLRTRPL